MQGPDSAGSGEGRYREGVCQADENLVKQVGQHHRKRSGVQDHRGSLESRVGGGGQKVCVAPESEGQPAQRRGELHQELAEGQFPQTNASAERKEGDGGSVQEGPEALVKTVREGTVDQEQSSHGLQKCEDGCESGKKCNKRLQFITHIGA